VISTEVSVLPMISSVSVSAGSLAAGLEVGPDVLLHGEANPLYKSSARHLASDPATQGSNSAQHAAE
jgi:hypothetical protein